MVTQPAAGYVDSQKLQVQRASMTVPIRISQIVDVPENGQRSAFLPRRTRGQESADRGYPLFTFAPVCHLPTADASNITGRAHGQ
jgi:hypothetical protein